MKALPVEGIIAYNNTEGMQEYARQLTQIIELIKTFIVRTSSKKNISYQLSRGYNQITKLNTLQFVFCRTQNNTIDINIELIGHLASKLE